MTALRATWLTWKLHRFETLVAVVLMLGVTISAAIVAFHLRALSIPAGCWEVVDAFDTSPMCSQLMRAHSDIFGNEGGHVRFGLIVVPTLVGLMLGSTLVGRELELRTAALAWSLDGGRRRWLAQRVGGVLLLVGLGLAAMAWMASGFEAAARRPDDMYRIGELATRGIPLLTRGLAALGIALLAGALLGRTLPALLIATLAVIILWGVGSGIVPKATAAPFAVWVDDAERRAGDYVHVVDYEERSPSSADEAYTEGLRVVCGPAPRAHDDRYEACLNTYDPSMVYGWWLVVPASALPVIEGAQAGLDLLVGGIGLAGTMVIVMRRRPD